MTHPFSTRTLTASRGTEGVPREAFDRRRRDVLVAAFDVERKFDLDFLGHRLHALDPTDGLFGRELLRKVLDVAVEGHDAVVGRDPDVRGIDARLPTQFRDDGLLQLTVLQHDLLHLFEARKAARLPSRTPRAIGNPRRRPIAAIFVRIVSRPDTARRLRALRASVGKYSGQRRRAAPVRFGFRDVPGGLWSGRACADDAAHAAGGGGA